MTISEIKSTVDQGIEVFWSNVGYVVIKDDLGQYLIKHHSGSCIGLTNQAGDTLNGNEEDFFTWIDMQSLAEKLDRILDIVKIEDEFKCDG